MEFPAPADFVYRPLDYAWEIHENYLRRFATGRRRALFLGMNPGPDGMGQTGVPFGDVVAVREWMGLRGDIRIPSTIHPARPVLGLNATRREPSGRRLWGLFEHRFGTADAFFTSHFVHNYCPLLFFKNTAAGLNITPEQLPAAVMRPVETACDEALRRLVAYLNPEYIVAVGKYATRRSREALGPAGPTLVELPHPSPANPAANRDWAGAATRVLVESGVWPRE